VNVRSMKERALVWITTPVFVFGCAWALAELGEWWSAAIVLLLVALAVCISGWYERRCATRAVGAESTDALGNTPRELAVIVVVGPYAASLFPRDAGRTMLRRDDRAVWLLADTPARLSSVMTQVKASRGRFPDAALLPVVPEGDDESALRREFAHWRIALQGSYCHPECVLPCHVAVYGCLGPAEDKMPQTRWFGDPVDIDVQRVENAMRPYDRLPAIRRQLAASRQPSAVMRSALGLAVFDWLDEAALLSSISTLANAAPFALRGVSLADVGYMSVRPGAWTRWLIARTGLQPRITKPLTGPLPLPFVRASRPQVDARRSALLSRSRAWPLGLHVLLSSVVALTATVAISGWTNYRIVERIAGNLSAYRNTPGNRITAKVDSFERLRADRDEVARNLRDGVPFGAGWGLYPGRALLVRLNAGLAGYRPPLTTVQIDSLSLFASGKAIFSPEAAHRELAHALQLIQANPDQRVLIEGHADSEGSPRANILLSEARARAIRDWLAAKGGLSVARFAIQGLGDVRPIADNSSEAGRALNRRVDVSLFPDSTLRR